MSSEAYMIIALLACAAIGWQVYRRTADARRRAADEDPFEAQDRARAHELAKAQADLQRWSGPH